MERPTPNPEELAQARDARIDAALHMLEAGVDRTMDSDEFKRHLEFVSRFHTYSPNNQMLIRMQCPDASLVAGYRKWQTLGRQVQKGERGMSILAPMVRTTTDEATGEREQRVTGFRLVKVFDVLQTEGDEIPRRPTPVELLGETDASHWLISRTCAYLQDNEVNVRSEETPGSPNARGSYEPGCLLIRVTPDMAPDQTAKTLVHEAAHWASNDQVTEDRRVVEPIVEGTAFVVLNHYGIDSSDYSFAYITGWTHGRDAFKSTLSRISTLSRQLIDGIGEYEYSDIDGPAMEENELLGSMRTSAPAYE